MTEQRTSRYHIIARALLVVVIILSQCLIWWPAAKTAVSAPDSSPAPLRVNVFHGEEYGSDSVGIAGQPRSSPEAAAERLCRTIATAASKGAIPPVHLRVSAQCVSTTWNCCDKPSWRERRERKCWSRGNFTKRRAYRQTLPAPRCRLVTKQVRNALDADAPGEKKNLMNNERRDGVPKLAERSGHRSGRRWLYVDLLLIAVALSGSVSTYTRQTASSHRHAPQLVLLEADTATAEASLYVDGANVIHSSTGRWDGHARLVSELKPLPSSMVILVHPDCLFATVARTTDVLRQAGVRRMQIATSESNPFVAIDRENVEKG